MHGENIDKITDKIYNFGYNWLIGFFTLLNRGKVLQILGINRGIGNLAI